MKVLKGEEIKNFIEGFIYEKKQVNSFSFDLTIKTISQLKSEAHLDFGGSEFKEAKKIKIEPIKESKEEKYGWWLLEKGEYLIEYNETLKIPQDKVGIIQPHLRIIMGGAFHPTLIVTSADSQVRNILRVGEKGLRIKENARISQLIVLE